MRCACGMLYEIDLPHKRALYGSMKHGCEMWQHGQQSNAIPRSYGYKWEQSHRNSVS